MIQIINNTTKDYWNFTNKVAFGWNPTVRRIPAVIKGETVMRYRVLRGMWEYYFTIDGNEAYVQCDHVYSDFSLWLEFDDNDKTIRIIKAIHKGRNLKADRYLKKFAQIAIIFHCLWKYDIRNKEAA